MLQPGIEGLSPQVTVVLSQKILRHLHNKGSLLKKQKQKQNITREPAGHTNMDKDIYFRLLYLQHFQANQLEAPLLKALNNLSNKTTLNSIWLHNYKSPLPLACKTCWDTENTCQYLQPTEKIGQILLHIYIIYICYTSTHARLCVCVFSCAQNS